VRQVNTLRSLLRVYCPAAFGGLRERLSTFLCRYLSCVGTVVDLELIVCYCDLPNDGEGKVGRDDFGEASGGLWGVRLVLRTTPSADALGCLLDLANNPASRTCDVTKRVQAPSSRGPIPARTAHPGTAPP
jgi:hypothetical protein